MRLPVSCRRRTLPRRAPARQTRRLGLLESRATAVAPTPRRSGRDPWTAHSPSTSTREPREPQSSSGRLRASGWRSQTGREQNPRSSLAFITRQHRPEVFGVLRPYSPAGRTDPLVQLGVMHRPQRGIRADGDDIVAPLAKPIGDHRREHLIEQEGRVPGGLMPAGSRQQALLDQPGLLC